MKQINWWSVGLVILILAIAGLAGSAVTDIGSWYQNLNKPSFQPPDWSFAPVWTIIYIFFGISMVLVFHTRDFNKSEIFLLYLLNLVLNIGWSYIFFTLHHPIAAFVELLFLWASIIIIQRSTWPYNRLSSYLLIPYLLWVSFAGVLNYSLVILNGGF